MENLERKISDALSELREDIIDDIHFAGHGEIYRVADRYIFDTRLRLIKTTRYFNEIDHILRCGE